jgi:hypothetical protein
MKYHQDLCLQCFTAHWQDQHAQKTIFRKIIEEDEIIAYDMSTLFTYSFGIRNAEFGYNNSDLNLPLIRFIRIVPSSVSYVDTLRKTGDEVHRGTLFVMDRCFINDDILHKIDTSVLYFIKKHR